MKLKSIFAFMIIIGFAFADKWITKDSIYCV